MATLEQPASSREDSRSERPKRSVGPIALVVGFVVVIAFAVFFLPPILRFFAFLFDGDIWRALIAVALLLLLVGVLVAGLLGRPETPRGARMRQLGMVLILASPLCIVVSLVGSGWLVDGVRWTRQAVPEIRNFLSGS